jgi:hypothetical protein
MLLDKNNVVLKRNITIRAQLREENGTVQLDGRQTVQMWR